MLAEKQGYITVPDKKYRLYGALGVGAIAMYVVYRGQTSKTKIKIKNEE